MESENNKISTITTHDFRTGKYLQHLKNYRQLVLKFDLLLGYYKVMNLFPRALKGFLSNSNHLCTEMYPPILSIHL